MKVLRRIAIAAVAVAVAVALAATAYVFVTVRRSFPQVDGTVTVAGITATVDVYRDRWGVPHVYARTSDDLFFAQGYVHAQDRFWEMDFRRHVTSGRLAELFGPDQVETDRFIRTLGWRNIAERELDILAPDTIRYLEAYSAGVNAFLADREGSQLSLEYAVLGLRNPGYEPEPWTPADSVTWLKAMAWDLRANVEDELERSLVAAKLGRERAEELYPPYPYGRHRPIVPDGSSVAGAVPAGPRPKGHLAALRATARTTRRVSGPLGASGAGVGSNSWVVSGERTASGEPLLANDPHLAPAMPSVWYQMGLHCTEITEDCPFDVAGFTFSGFPGVIIGHNARIAWGFTNLGADVADLYLERVDGDRYEVDGESRSLEIRTETIVVAGSDHVEVEVRSTHHGPLVSDASKTFSRAGVGEAVALRWTALTPGRTADAVFALNEASDLTEMRAAAALLEVPSQNIVYADVDGTIAYQAPGRIPIRQGYDGSWPVPGWTSRYDWEGFIPFARLPHVVDPHKGFIVTANNAVVGDSYPFMLSRDWDGGYRSERIRKLLKPISEATIADMKRIQNDELDPKAAILLPHLDDVDVPEPARSAQALLRDWGARNGAGSAAAAYFNAVWRHLLRLAFDDELPRAWRADGSDRWFEVVRRLLTDERSRWWDDIRTDVVEERDHVLRRALIAADRELRTELGDDPTAWRWGDIHTLELRNQSFGQSGIGPIEWLFNRGPLRPGGGEDVVDATGWTAHKGYEVDWVPSMRMIVDLGDLDASRWVNLTGASGHAFHEHYFDQAELWEEGRTTAMLWGRASVEAAAADHLILRPAD